jgi:phospholipase C
MRVQVTLAVALVLLKPLVVFAQPANCNFNAGAAPADTLPPGTPHGSVIPIDHIVLLMQENRSFDEYFGQLHLSGQPKAQGPRANARDVDPTGTTGGIRRFHQTALCEVSDLDHSWTGTHVSVDGGKMDRFTEVNASGKDPNGHRAMGFYTAKDLNFYYKLYKTFAIGDHYFCSVQGPTFPNRFYYLAGTSFGHINNDFPQTAAEFTQRSIFNALDEAGITWKVYYSQIAFAQIFGYVRNTRMANLVPVEQYFSDAAAGTLPQVSFVDPIFTDKVNVENDEHPPANVQIGQQFAASIVEALMKSPLWSRSVLFLTYDEHGGYYDHVPPPAACIPDDIPPLLSVSDVNAQFDAYGVRVPVVVISPYAKKHFVSHVVHDHTSILRFVETRFDLPALTRRDANADPMLEFFDFSKPKFARPPNLPTPTIDQSKKAACDAIAAGGS